MASRKFDNLIFYSMIAAGRRHFGTSRSMHRERKDVN